jgi:diaminopimelate decarboxylase
MSCSPRVPAAVQSLAGMSVADLLAEHGSPLWLANLDVVRDRSRAFAQAWRSAWPDVQIAYSLKANRLPAIVRAIGEQGIGNQVGSEAEYRLARSITDVDGRAIVVQGPAKPPALLELAAADGALVVADSLAELRRLASAGVRRVGLRVSLPGVGHGTSHFGVPMAEVPTAPRHAASLGLRIEALAVHLVSAGFDHPLTAEDRLASHLMVRWPQPPERFATAARMLAGMAGRMGIPIIDVGGGFPPAPQEALYARAVTGSIGGAGFEGRVLVEPGRALVADAVDLACTVTAVKRLPDRKRCVVLDAGTNLLPGTLFAWPTIEAPGADPAAGTAVVVGPLCTNVDVLHPAAPIGAVSEGDAIVIRGMGAYQQSQSTQFGDLRPAVVARDDGHWRLVSRRESVDDLLATDLGAHVAPAAR